LANKLIDDDDRWDDTPDLGPISEAQKISGGESRSSIYRALRRGELVAVKRGRSLLIDLNSARRRAQTFPRAKFGAADSGEQVLDTLRPVRNAAALRDPE
jgi:hypothetical protein